MNIFINHKTIKVEDEYIVELYLQRQYDETSMEFLSNKQEKVKDFKKEIKNYIEYKIPNLRIKTINIMLGSLLITSIPFNSINVEASTHSNPIPTKATNNYIVMSGDTLFKIAKKFGITVKHLKDFNHLKTNLIYPNQIIYIPTKDIIKIINSLPNNIIHIGHQGNEVKNIQRALNKIGHHLAVDGIYGPNTKSAILRFQNQYKSLTDDGIYGPNTKNYLEQTLLNNNIKSNPSDVLVLVNKNNPISSDYIPENLVIPNVSFPFKEYNPKKLMRKDAALALEKLFIQGKRENIDLYAVSGYRSYDRQNTIFNSNVNKHGLEIANQFSAKPGQSEHQTGLAMDITSRSVNFSLTQNFGKTKEGKWIKENAHKFGFIIRYPQGKESITGYQYEPWHLRYVGNETAKDITDKNITLEEYLGRK